MSTCLLIALLKNSSCIASTSTSTESDSSIEKSNTSLFVEEPEAGGYKLLTVSLSKFKPCPSVSNTVAIIY